MGLVLAANALFVFLLLFAIDVFAGHRNPYLGILAYLVRPCCPRPCPGLARGVASEAERAAVRSCGQATRHQDRFVSRRTVLAMFAGGSVIFLFLTALGSYQTYQSLIGSEFCGQRCHLPMSRSSSLPNTRPMPGSSVSPATWDGRHGVFQDEAERREAALSHRGAFLSRRRVTNANPRPSQAICEQCHWPKKYVGNVEQTYQHFLSDEKNTPFTVRLLLNVGGADPANGPEGGIHWHMNVANKIEYIATDDLLRTSHQVG